MPADTRLYATPPGLRLSALADIADGAARGFRLDLKGGRFDGFVVRSGDSVTGYVDLCPHAGVPLAARPDGYTVHAVSTGLLVACTWHGALFRVEDGVCVAGPCVKQRLRSWPVGVRKGMVVTARAGPAPWWWRLFGRV
ncbi:Rieske (2Fe-2S) protein [Sphingomonas sp. NFR15]|uniref:Rieske (2Fe-2S) protein n=1 Tax=Sphingomonas sp. NFR15 TaxID=1566282 RepID=UPI00087EFB4D|nr:Rieske (2Fe-2S) protein [Sphingomonas sp. NFR15]SDA34955.1 Ferredoxin subunit of nitrite reductase or a ring-hydroxylating dioxygenase [Sphingomonas sp. NFR15]